MTVYVSRASNGTKAPARRAPERLHAKKSAGAARNVEFLAEPVSSLITNYVGSASHFLAFIDVKSANYLTGAVFRV